MITREKQTLRQKMREALAGLPNKAEFSQLIARSLRSLPFWESARVIYGYSPLGSEPEWRGDFVDANKQIAYPRVVGDAMLFFCSERFEKGALGTWEPVGEVLAPPADLILVPGVAFDTSGHRLGRGKGYYDRWLAERGSARAVGVCFECQIVTEVPREPHDVRVDLVLTEKRGF
jgi:5-formyltetrahydrofolate cyclo-ligase